MLLALSAVRRRLQGVPHHELAALADELDALAADGMTLADVSGALLERAAEDVRERLLAIVKETGS